MSAASFLRYFRIHIVARLLLICTTVAVSTYGWHVGWSTIVYMGLVGFAFFQSVGLVRHLERGTRDLLSFFEAIEFSDFTQSFSAPFHDGQFKQLYGAFSRVMERFREARAKNEVQRQYFETLIHHIGTGLLCYHPDGAVQLMNSAAKKILDRPALNHIQDLQSLSPAFVDVLMNLKTGEHDLIKIDTERDWLQLSVHATRFNLLDQSFVLVSLQNISAELEEKELEAVQHMTRVLAHEIMNSITPIASLAGIAKTQLTPTVMSADHPAETEALNDLRDALDTIEKRSQGLLHFVESYRKMARIPRPEFKHLQVQELFGRVIKLLAPAAENKGISIEVQVEPLSLSVLADPDLIEQALINLLKNAIEAIQPESNGHIQLEGVLDRRSKVQLKITDNGPGIPAEVMNQIFVPFYSTKPTGSGIGLSLSKQIMRRHGGSLRVQSQQGGPTMFTLRF